MHDVSSEKLCPKCGAVMSRGFLVDNISPLASIMNLGESIRWTPGEEDILISKKVATIAYACPKCGYIEQYVRNLE